MESITDLDLYIMTILMCAFICSILWETHFKYIYKFKTINIGDIYTKTTQIDDENPWAVKTHKYKILDKKNAALLVLDLTNNVYDIISIFELIDRNYKIEKHNDVASNYNILRKTK